MSIEVRLAAEADSAEIGQMIDAMDRHYRGAQAMREPARAVALVREVLRSREGTNFLLAFNGGQPVGLACFAILRPGIDLTGLIFLKDLFVLESMRGKGIGRKMMAALARFALDNGIGRIDLTTDASNIDAQRLYEKLEARQQTKVAYRFDGDALASLAEES